MNQDYMVFPAPFYEMMTALCESVFADSNLECCPVEGNSFNVIGKMKVGPRRELLGLLKKRLVPFSLFYPNSDDLIETHFRVNKQETVSTVVKLDGMYELKLVVSKEHYQHGAHVRPKKIHADEIEAHVEPIGSQCHEAQLVTYFRREMAGAAEYMANQCTGMKLSPAMDPACIKSSTWHELYDDFLSGLTRSAYFSLNEKMKAGAGEFKSAQSASSV